jgi:hypothetical protein
MLLWNGSLFSSSEIVRQSNIKRVIFLGLLPNSPSPAQKPFDKQPTTVKQMTEIKVPTH